MTCRATPHLPTEVTTAPTPTLTSSRDSTSHRDSTSSSVPPQQLVPHTGRQDPHSSSSRDHHSSRGSSREAPRHPSSSSGLLQICLHVRWVLR
jgi:hypothetical protein